MRVRRFKSFGTPSIWDIVGGGVAAAASGNIMAGLSAVYDRIEIRTSVTPPAVIDLHAAASAPPSELTKFLQPTIILHGASGREVIAPYGEADGGWGGPVFALAMILGVGFALGRASK